MGPGIEIAANIHIFLKPLNFAATNLDDSFAKGIATKHGHMNLQ